MKYSIFFFFFLLAIATNAQKIKLDGFYLGVRTLEVSNRQADPFFVEYLLKDRSIYQDRVADLDIQGYGSGAGRIDWNNNFYLSTEWKLSDFDRIGLNLGFFLSNAQGGDSGFGFIAYDEDDLIYYYLLTQHKQYAGVRLGINAYLPIRPWWRLYVGFHVEWGRSVRHYYTSRYENRGTTTPLETMQGVRYWRTHYSIPFGLEFQIKQRVLIKPEFVLGTITDRFRRGYDWLDNESHGFSLWIGYRFD